MLVSDVFVEQVFFVESHIEIMIRFVNLLMQSGR